MGDSRGVASIPDEPWISLDRALAWICFDVAIDLETLTAVACAQMGLTADEVRQQYQDAWRTLAYEASSGALLVRGRRVREIGRAPSKRRLSADDLFSCSWLDFVRYPEGPIVRVSRYDRDFKSVWKGSSDEEGWDYSDLVVRRVDLLKFKRRKSSVRRKATVADGLAALQHLRTRIHGVDAAEIRKADLIKEMRSTFRITRDTARANWNIVTADRADLRAGGRRKRAVK